MSFYPTFVNPLTFCSAGEDGLVGVADFTVGPAASAFTVKVKELLAFEFARTLVVDVSENAPASISTV